MVEIKLLGNIDVDSWEDLTNKSIYTGFAEMFTKTKVERESARPMDLVWERLTKLGANRQVQEVSYLLVHDKLPVLERLFRIGLAKDPYCDSCDAAVEQDACHYFSQCAKIKDYWKWLRTVLYQIIGAEADQLLDQDLLSYSWRRSTWDAEISWLLSCYVWFVWDRLKHRGMTNVNGRELFGFLRFKYKDATMKKLIREFPGMN